jgi:hypothetical protein
MRNLLCEKYTRHPSLWDCMDFYACLAELWILRDAAASVRVLESAVSSSAVVMMSMIRMILAHNRTVVYLGDSSCR